MPSAVRETLELWSYGSDRTTVVVEYREVPHWNQPSDLKVYEVLDAGGNVVGRVEQYRETVERRPRGSRIVTSRRTAKTKRWIPRSPVRSSYGLTYASRRNAVAQLFGYTTARKV
jgi:hypothetical protein